MWIPDMDLLDEKKDSDSFYKSDCDLCRYNVDLTGPEMLEIRYVPGIWILL